MPALPLPKIFADLAARPPNRQGTIPLPLSSSDFSFDSFGVAGFFGGDTSVAGMATVNLIPFRRWAGWYNNPGSYEIAKKYGPLGKTRWLDGLFPDGEHDPAKLFKLDGADGPAFVAAHSGTMLPQTGHLSHLVAKRVARVPLSHEPFKGEHGRLTTSPGVTVVDMRNGDRDVEVRELLSERSQPPLPASWTAAWSLVPIAASGGACVVCALVGDWFCFVSIAVGIAAHGLACCVIGSGKLTFLHPKPAAEAPPGDGVLKGSKEWVILIGAEGMVNAFTRGRFRLHYGAEDRVDLNMAVQGGEGVRSSGDSTYPYHDKEGSAGALATDRDRLLSRPDRDSSEHPSSIPPMPHAPSTGSPPSTPSRSSNSWAPPQWLIGACAVLLMVQFIGQLLVIPHGTLFGQIMFIATVLASWVYNTYLASIDSDELQVQILYEEMQIHEGTHFRKYQLNTFTATVAFTCFVLESANPLKEPSVFLDAVLPNSTEVWRTWKRKMAEKMKGGLGTPIVFSDKDLEAVEEESDRKLLRMLFDDAQDAWVAWSKVRG